MRTLIALNLRLTRRGALIWGVALAVAMAANAAGWTSTPPRERLQLAETLGASAGFRALVGPPVGLETTGGFIAWRTGVFVALALGIWGSLTTTRLLRGEEDVGRWDVVRSQPLTAAGATVGVLAAIAVDVAVVWVLVLGGLLVLGPPFDIAPGGAIVFASTLALAALAFAMVGAVAAQIASTRRTAVAIGGGVVGAAMAVRTVADMSEATWLRWVSPLGWVSQVRAFDGPRPAVLLLFVALALASAALAVVLARGRDVGAGLLPSRDRAEAGRAPRTPETAALRFGRGQALAWIVGAVSLSALIGSIAPTVQESLGGSGIERFVAGLGNFASVRAYLSFGAFLPLTVATAAFMAGSIGDHWEEERTGRADTILATAVSRRRWLAGRVVLTATTATVLVVASATAAWVGVVATGSGVSLPGLLGAGLSVLPIAAAFLGLGVALYGVAPRGAAATIYTLVGAAFLLQIVGSVSRWPGWVLGLSPFYHRGSSPLGPVNLRASLVLLGVAVAAFAIGVEAFARRDVRTA